MHNNLFVLGFWLLLLVTSTIHCGITWVHCTVYGFHILLYTFIHPSNIASTLYRTLHRKLDVIFIHDLEIFKQNSMSCCYKLLLNITTSRNLILLIMKIHLKKSSCLTMTQSNYNQTHLGSTVFSLQINLCIFSVFIYTWCSSIQCICISDNYRLVLLSCWKQCENSSYAALSYKGL